MMENIKEVILCKYGEVVLKGANRSDFEKKMLKELRLRAKRLGNYNIFYSQSTIYIEPIDEEAIERIDEMYWHAKHVFGFVGVARAYTCKKDMDEIKEVVRTLMPERLRGYKTFKVESKRSDKRFPLKSPEISDEVGGVVLSTVHGIKVDVRNPEVVLRVEIREKEAFIHAGLALCSKGTDSF